MNCWVSSVHSNATSFLPVVKSRRCCVRYSFSRCSNRRHPLQLSFSSANAAVAVSNTLLLAPIGPVVSNILELPSPHATMNELLQLAADYSRLMDFDKLLEALDQKKLSSERFHESLSQIADTMEDMVARNKLLRMKLYTSNDFMEVEALAIMDAAKLVRQNESPMSRINMNSILMEGRSGEYGIDLYRTMSYDDPPPRPCSGAIEEFIKVKEMRKYIEANSNAPTTVHQFIPLRLNLVEMKAENEAVAEELDQVILDHRRMYKMGKNYGSFDRGGKIAFLNALETVEERWIIILESLLDNNYIESNTQQVLDAFELKSIHSYYKTIQLARERLRTDSDTLSV